MQKIQEWITYLNEARAKSETDIIEILNSLDALEEKFQGSIVGLNEKCDSNKKLTEKLLKEISNFKKRISLMEKKLKPYFIPEGNYTEIRSIDVTENTFEDIRLDIDNLTHQYGRHNILISCYRRDSFWQIIVLIKDNKSVSIALKAFREIENLVGSYASDATVNSTSYISTGSGSDAQENLPIQTKKSIYNKINDAFDDFFDSPYIESKIIGIFLLGAIGVIFLSVVSSAIINIISR